MTAVADAGERRIGVSQLALRPPRLRDLEDPKEIASVQRVRRLTGQVELDERLIPMCTVIRADHGGSLRTFSGGLAQENGWYPSQKAGRLLHWHGETALWMLVASEVDHDVVRIGSENVAFEIPIDGEIVGYTADVELVGPDGVSTLVEVKRTERDLEDPAYRLKLAYVHEICRRIGMRFDVRFRRDVFRTLQHRRNAGLFASRAFVDPGAHHMARLARHRRSTGGQTTYGRLAVALEPERPVTGKAIVQALLVRRLVTMDLTLRLHDLSPVVIV